MKTSPWLDPTRGMFYVGCSPYAVQSRRDGRIIENCMIKNKSRRDDIYFTNNDTPTGLNGWLAKIYNHLTPSGSSQKYFV
jgi:hypothetical protein